MPKRNEMADAANGVFGMFPIGACTGFTGIVVSGLFFITAR